MSPKFIRLFPIFSNGFNTALTIFLVWYFYSVQNWIFVVAWGLAIPVYATQTYIVYLHETTK